MEAIILLFVWRFYLFSNETIKETTRLYKSAYQFTRFMRKVCISWLTSYVLALLSLRFFTIVFFGHIFLLAIYFSFFLHETYVLYELGKISDATKKYTTLIYMLCLIIGMLVCVPVWFFALNYY